MKILVQVGDLGSSVIDHLISPLAGADGVTGLLVVCRRAGPVIHKVTYYYPPRFIAANSVSAILYELGQLVWLGIFARPAWLAGYKLFPHGIIAFLVSRLARKPYIISIIAGRAELYEMGKCPLGVNLTRPLPWLGSFFIHILRHAGAIITTGTVTKDFLLNHQVMESKVFPIVSPPNQSRFYPLQTQKVYDVLSVSRLHPAKHVEIILHAIAKVKQKRPSIKACVVGNGPCQSELVRLAQELKIEKNVDFAGFQKNVPCYYHTSKLLVLASEREGFPNVVLEAMACGVPCIISNCGDIMDLARDGQNSLVIQDFTDYVGFANAISRLLEDEELYTKIARNGLQTVQSNSRESVISKWNFIINDIVRNQSMIRR